MLLDANLLIYAYVASQPQHEAAQPWLEQHLEQPQPRVGMPWPSLLAFVRIVSNPRAFARPVPVARAWQQVEQWLQCACVWIPLPTDRHAAVLGALIQTGTSRHSRLVSDAHLAALALEHDLTLYSTDGDFARFPSLRWENPLR
jgi:toxin-antitoxin system PIN domain toxin